MFLQSYQSGGKFLALLRKYFGTDGIRGLVGEFPITPEFFMRLGYSAGKVLCGNGNGMRPSILVGKDTRLSGYIFESALQAGLLAAGVDVYMTGPASTPAVAFLTKDMDFQAGVVISASHNSHEYNGIKFFGYDGSKISEHLEKKIEQSIDVDNPLNLNEPQNLGKSYRASNFHMSYVDFCKNTFPGKYSLKEFRLVVDCANGATYNVAEDIFKSLGAEVVLINAKPNGFNINEGCGSLHPESLIKALQRYDGDIGIAFDGDGDRVLMADRNGKIYEGDQLLYIIAMHRKSLDALGGGVVGTLMTNLGLENAFKDQGILFERVGVGDRYVLEKISERGWLLGGENSGHLICLDKHSTGDGIVSSLQVLAALCFSGCSLEESCVNLHKVPQVLINVPVPPGFNFEQNNDITQSIIAMQKDLGGDGRVLVRASGTESVVRVMVEAGSAEVTQNCAKSLAELIRIKAKGNPS